MGTVPPPVDKKVYGALTADIQCSLATLQQLSADAITACIYLLTVMRLRINSTSRVYDDLIMI